MHSSDDDPRPAVSSPSATVVVPYATTTSGPDAGARQLPGAPAAAQGRVAETERRLEALRQLPLAEHPEVYAALHADLHGALAEIDDS